jgi:hypothetical protein
LKNELSYKIYITDKFQINHNNYNKCTFWSLENGGNK